MRTNRIARVVSTTGWCITIIGIIAALLAGWILPLTDYNYFGRVEESYNLGLAIGMIAAIVVVGVVFQALAEIIELLQKSVDKMEHFLTMAKKKPDSQEGIAIREVEQNLPDIEAFDLSDRFSVLYRLGNDLYAKGSPVLIVAGTLLQDRTTGLTFARIKFRNLAAQNIVRAKVTLYVDHAEDAEHTGNTEFEYTGLNAKTGVCWGADQAIPLPGASSFAVAGISVLFSGRTKWKEVSFSDATKLPEGVLLDQKITDAELISKYWKEINQYAKYVPETYGDLWRCTCGTVNQTGMCYHCQASKYRVLIKFDDMEQQLKEATRKI